VALAKWPVAGVTAMQVALVYDGERTRGNRGLNLPLQLGNAHA
jgi:hypothetical protein